MTLLQGLLFQKSKENYENAEYFETLEKKFSQILDNYRIEYNKLACELKAQSEESAGRPKPKCISILWKEGKDDMKIEDQKKKIAKLNDQLENIANQAYTKIVEVKGISEEKSENNFLKEYNSLTENDSPNKKITMNALKNEFKLKAKSEKIRYTFWDFLTKVFLLGVIFFFIMKGNPPTLVKIIMLVIIFILGYILLTGLFETFVRHCKNFKKIKNPLCYILVLLGKIFPKLY